MCCCPGTHAERQHLAQRTEASGEITHRLRLTEKPRCCCGRTTTTTTSNNRSQRNTGQDPNTGTFRSILPSCCVVVCNVVYTCSNVHRDSSFYSISFTEYYIHVHVPSTSDSLPISFEKYQNLKTQCWR